MQTLPIMLAIGCLVGITVLSAIGPAVAADKNPIVVMDTSMGTIKIELDPAKARITVENFLRYVDDKFYDGTIFHRVMSDFMIQGGGFLPDMTQKKTRATIKNESPNGLSNVRGTIAMARLPQPDTASAQFFINVVDNQHLDKPRYCVFGKVIEGMDVVDKIRQVETGDAVDSEGNPHEKVPTKVVLIKTVRRADK